MAEDEKEKSFKVVDKRHSAGGDEETTKEEPKSGEGFTMKEGKAPQPSDIDFSTFILSLATGAMINLGLSPDPVTNKTEKNLTLAKQNIDILALIEEKTKGNLSKDEATLMESLLTEVRLRFVDASK